MDDSAQHPRRHGRRPDARDRGSLQAGRRRIALDDFDGPVSLFPTEAPMGPSDLLRALGIPASWHFFLLSLAAMLTLAGLDFVGAIFAKEWVEERQAGWFLGGLVAFGILFAVYAYSLQYAELSL